MEQDLPINDKRHDVVYVEVNFVKVTKKQPKNSIRLFVKQQYRCVVLGKSRSRTYAQTFCVVRNMENDSVDLIPDKNLQECRWLQICLHNNTLKIFKIRIGP